MQILDPHHSWPASDSGALSGREKSPSKNPTYLVKSKSNMISSGKKKLCEELLKVFVRVVLCLSGLVTYRDEPYSRLLVLVSTQIRLLDLPVLALVGVRVGVKWVLTERLWGAK
jgi:hypothetical protein